MQTNSWLNRLLVLFLIVLPTGPIVWDYIYPGTYARWLLAYAANQYDSGNIEKAQALLARAYELSPDISRDRNFWEQLGRIELSPENTRLDQSIWTQLIRKIPNVDQRADAASLIASMMFERRMYPQAVSIMNDYFPAAKKRNAMQNNLLAYARALTNQDLEEALTEIDLAVAEQVNESFLDTKAWILHRMGRNEEALTEIDRSMAMLMERLHANSTFNTLLESMEKFQSDHPPSEPNDNAATDSDPNTQEKPETGWAYSQLQEKFPWLARASAEYTTLAILHYHRMKILEASKLQKQAAEEADWLRAFAPKPWDSLE